MPADDKPLPQHLHVPFKGKARTLTAAFEQAFLETLTGSHLAVQHQTVVPTYTGNS